MPKVLIIPIEVNALYVNKKVSAAPASANFSDVPFIDENGYFHNLENPFISENMVSHPFDENHQLEKGIHLHFQIPIGFKTPQKLNTDEEETYPPLPNRWLITKNNSEKWIVESDYLWAEKDNAEEKKKSITILLPKKGIQDKTVYSRCRYLGRKYAESEFPKAKGNGNYWREFYGNQGITAIGYGEPTFSGFYPNCQSVFGFYDENGKAEDSYEVVGWYEQQADLKAIMSAFSDNDIFKNHLFINNENEFEQKKTIITNLKNQYDNIAIEATKTEFYKKYEKYLFLEQNGITSLNFSDAKNLEIRYNQVKAFENAYEVNYAANKELLQLPEQICFVSKIKVTENGKTEQQHTINEANIAIGNTGREALNALKAQQTYDAFPQGAKAKTKAQIEADLELIHCDAIVDKQVDFHYQFEQERQEKTFSKIEGGKYWQLMIQLQDNDMLSTDNQQNAALNKLLDEPIIERLRSTLAARISTLNGLRFKYNKQSHSIKSQQHQLFADWYKYMLTVHPPLYDTDNYLNSDEVLRFINRYVIKGIFDTIHQTDIIDNNTRQTLEAFNLNQGLDKAILEQLNSKFQNFDFTKFQNTVLGKIVAVLFKNTNVKEQEAKLHLLQKKDFFRKSLQKIATFQKDFKATNTLISQLNQVKDQTLSIDAIESENHQIEALKIRKKFTDFVNNWNTLFDANNDFDKLKNFFNDYKNNSTDEILKALKDTITRLENAKKQYESAVNLLVNLSTLNRLEINQLLPIITLLTDNEQIRTKANEYLAKNDDSELENARTFVDTHLKNIIVAEVKAAIKVVSSDFNDNNFKNQVAKTITNLKNQIDNYFKVQINSLAKAIKNECQILQTKIDKSLTIYTQIDAVLSNSSNLINNINDANINQLKDVLTTLKSTIDNIKLEDINISGEKSILQLLQDFETAIKQTIATLEEEKTGENGVLNVVKKYKILKDKTIDIRLSNKSEPRYYEAKEPVVLIEASGLNAELLVENGSEITYDKQAFLEVSFTDFDLNTIDKIKQTDTFKNLNVLTLNAAFWNPIIMDWRVEYLAVNDPSISQKYNADFVNDTFVLNDNALELQLEKTQNLNQKIFNTAGRIYSGSTLLSPHAIRVIEEKLKEYKTEEELSPKGVLFFDNVLSSFDDDINDIFELEEMPTARGLMVENTSELSKLLKRSNKIQTYIQDKKTQEKTLDKELKINNINLNIQKKKRNILQNTINAIYGNIRTDLPRAKGLGDSGKKTILSQSLGGFNQCLLMRKQTMQLEVDDPIALDKYKPLVENIRNYVDDATRSAPEPRHYFNPIRSGAMRLEKLRIVDSFGQIAKVNFEETQVSQPSKVIVAETLIAQQQAANDETKPIERKGYDAFLPTRVVQPLRLDLRWISNSDTNIEAQGTHNSPICGWIVPNFLNTTFTIFSTKGKLLGDVGLVRDANDKAIIRLLPKPGAFSFYDFEITNGHLRELVQYIINQGAEWFMMFLKNINETMVYADPEGFERHTEISMLVGKPLALVRSRVGFQAMENYAVNQDWAVFEKDIRNTENQNYKRNTYAFEHVDFPIKLGHAQALNDGLFGFWIEEDKDKNEFRPVLKTKGFKANNVIKKTIDDEGTLLTMLFDPRAKLHGFTGILPTKTITIPEELYAEALKKMKVYFSVGPFITPKSKLQFPIPQSKVYEWKWVYQANKSLTEISTKPTIEKAVFEIAWKQQFDTATDDAWTALLDNNWLQPTEENITTAYVNFDEKTRLPLPQLDNINEDWTAKADDIINQHYKGIAPTTPDVTFGQFELREGWLKLMNEL